MDTSVERFAGNVTASVSVVRIQFGVICLYMFVIFKKCGVTASSAKAVHDKQGFSRFCVQEKNFVSIKVVFTRWNSNIKIMLLNPLFGTGTHLIDRLG